MAFFVLLLLLLAQAVHAVVDQSGFLSIDCGLDDKYSGYPDEDTGIIYVSDGPYTDAGENLMVGPEYQNMLLRRFKTVRSFPSGVRNCYSLPTEAGSKYLVRVMALYGNYDGRNDSSSMEFDLYLGASSWETVRVADDLVHEAVFVARASWAPVCLLNTGHGAPFLSYLELRKLPGALYPTLTASQAMSLFERNSMGAGSGRLTRFPDDLYERVWFAEVGSSWKNLSTTLSIHGDPSFIEPLPVLQTAVEPTGNDTTLSYTWRAVEMDSFFMVFLHFADIQNTQTRQFDIYYNDKLRERLHNPPYLASSSVYNTEWYRIPDRKYNITLVATAASVLPPMLNAIEIYTLISFDKPTTSPKDFDAIMAIKLEYGVIKNWMGDPCFPAKDKWDGVKCSNSTSDNTVRITSLNLSNSSLNGSVSKSFTLLTALENLDLSNNNLDGSIPDSLPSLPSLRVLNLSANHLSGDALCKNYTGSLVFRYESDGHMCDKTISTSKNRTAVIAISVVVPVLVVALLLLAYFIWREKRKPTVSTHDPTSDPPLESTLETRKGHMEHIQNADNRRFTYKELEKFTNNLKRPIGKGGFGFVYYGRIEDGTEVAVKMRSESSSHGLDEFFAEVQSLTTVHHRNLVSLIGYCWEKHHLALVYEYMSQGSLFDRLRGKIGGTEALNWGTRVRVALGAAEGLDYLHKGCNLPIIHRDVKTSNILLGQNLQAKIADFGLCKTYLSDTQTHISTSAAGTAGYMDPEYYKTGRLTESSDVYSFGIVLLEVVTGELPIVSGRGHIVQRVKQMIATGDISLIADARLGDAYDVSSIWKVVDVAMMCVADAAFQRPTMATVVVLLKESLALEEARENDTNISASREAGMVSAFLPLAR